jgi:hypothetical protein
MNPPWINYKCMQKIRCKQTSVYKFSPVSNQSVDSFLQPSIKEKSGLGSTDCESNILRSCPDTAEVYGIPTTHKGFKFRKRRNRHKRYKIIEISKEPDIDKTNDELQYEKLPEEASINVNKIEPHDTWETNDVYESSDFKGHQEVLELMEEMKQDKESVQNQDHDQEDFSGLEEILECTDRIEADDPSEDEEIYESLDAEEEKTDLLLMEEIEHDRTQDQEDFSGLEEILECTDRIEADDPSEDEEIYESLDAEEENVALQLTNEKEEKAEEEEALQFVLLSSVEEVPESKDSSEMEDKREKEEKAEEEEVLQLVLLSSAEEVPESKGASDTADEREEKAEKEEEEVLQLVLLSSAEEILESNEAIEISDRPKSDAPDYQKPSECGCAGDHPFSSGTGPINGSLPFSHHVVKMKVPVVVGEYNAEVIVEEDTVFEEEIMNIREVSRQVVLTHSQFVPAGFSSSSNSGLRKATKGTLFLEGYIYKNIQYAPVDQGATDFAQIDQKRNHAKLYSANMKVPFSTFIQVTQFVHPPIFGDTDQRTFNFIERTNGRVPEWESKLFETITYYHDPPYSELVRSNIHEMTCYEEELAPPSLQLRQKVVVELEICLLQVQQVELKK